MTTKERFYADNIEAARRVIAAERVNLEPEFVLAQAALESRYGQSALAKVYGNFFGIKADANWRGPSVNMRTQEYFSSTPTTIKDNFRTYSGFEESAKDYIRFLKMYSRYRPTLQAKNAQDRILAIGKSGYATAPDYTQAMQNFFAEISAIARRYAKGELLAIFAILAFAPPILLSLWHNN